MNGCGHIIVATFCLCAWGVGAFGASGALLLGGAAGDESGMRQIQQDMDLFSANLAPVGVAPGALVRLDERAPYDPAAVDAALAGLAERVKKGEIDRLWVGVFGHAQQGRRELLLKLPRGTYPAPRLVKALDAMDIPQQVFCFNTLSRELADLLVAGARRDRLVVSAVSRAGYRNPPGIPGFFLREWREGRAENFVELTRNATLAAQRSAAAREVFFDEQPLLAWGGTAAEFPFSGIAAQELPPLRAAAVSTAVTREKDGARSAVADGPDARIERRRLLLSLNGDGALHVEERCEIVVQTAAGAERLTAVQLPPPAGASACEILEATHLRPDGASGDVQRRGDTMELRFPGLEPGSRISYAYRWDEALSGAARTGAFLSREVPLAREYPQRELEFVFSLPKKFFAAWRLYGLSGAPGAEAGETPYSRTYRFVLKDVPAAEALPDLPPEDAAGARAVFSLVPDWKSFAAQYLALIDGCDRLNAEGEALALRLAAGAKDKEAVLARLYDFVNALRYDITPYGARALRPRLPEAVLASGTADCKDKANLLIALARVHGIEGRMALLRRGGSSDPEFPSWQFNHAIAYFPKLAGYPDGLWLDATDSETPFGTLPPGDANRPALVFFADGARFLPVKAACEQNNVCVREWRVRALPDGSAAGEWVGENRGIFAYAARRAWKNRSPELRRFAAQHEVGSDWRGAEVRAATAAEVGGVWTERVAFTAPRMAPPALTRAWGLPFEMPGRTAPMLLYDGQGYTLVERVRFGGGAAKDAAKTELWTAESPHYRARLTRRGTPEAWEAELTISGLGGRVAAADYPEDRALWSAAAGHWDAIQEKR